MKEKTGRPASPDFITGLLEEDLERRDFIPRSSTDIDIIVAIISIEVSGDTTLGDHDLVLVDCTYGDVTISLPQASTRAGKEYRIKKIDDTHHKVIVDPYLLETIDGEEEIWIDFQYNAMTIVSDGDEWYIV